MQRFSAVNVVSADPMDGRSKGLADQLLALLPKRFRVARIQRVAAHSFADRADGHIVRNDLPDVAILAVASSDLLRRSQDRGPDGGRRALGNGLVLKRRLTLRGELLVELVDDLPQGG